MRSVRFRLPILGASQQKLVEIGTELPNDIWCTPSVTCLEKPFEPEALRRLVAERLAGATTPAAAAT